MSHDNYELPSIYTRKPEQDNGFEESEDEIDLINTSRGQTHILSPGPSRQYRDIHIEDNRLAWLLLGAAFFTLIMTIIPVVCNLPNLSPWFTGDALWRFFDPVITLPLNLFIITRADIMLNGRSNYCKDKKRCTNVTDIHILLFKGGALSEASVTWLLWTLGAGLYVQFHGVHTAAALFKVKHHTTHLLVD